MGLEQSLEESWFYALSSSFLLKALDQRSTTMSRVSNMVIRVIYTRRSKVVLGQQPFLTPFLWTNVLTNPDIGNHVEGFHMPNRAKSRQLTCTLADGPSASGRMDTAFRFRVLM
jgi:hypothetical protein